MTPRGRNLADYAGIPEMTTSRSARVSVVGIMYGDIRATTTG